MLKALIRWLARKEISEAYEAGSALGQVLAASDAMARCELAQARGVAEGQARAFDALEEAVRARMGGVVDFVMPEDIKRAKKGLLH